MSTRATQPAGRDKDLPFPPERYPYGSTQRYHLQHVHLFASDVDRTMAFYKKWFDAEVIWDGDYAGARNIFMKVGIGAIHLYDQLPRGEGKNAVHHLGMQVVGLEDLYARMVAEGVPVRNPIRGSGGSGYFMLEAPDGVLLELFEPGPQRDPKVRSYYGYTAT
jgi:predicted enzyme related to lactoylglutathione lyase